MTIPVSTAPAVKVYLETALSSALSPESGHRIDVRRDMPGPNKASDIVVIGNVTDRHVMPWQLVGSGGRGAYREEYQVEIVISVFRGGDFASATNDRAWEILAEIETAIRDDPSLGGLVIVAHPDHSAEQSIFEPAHKGRETNLVLSVKVEAGL